MGNGWGVCMMSRERGTCEIHSGISREHALVLGMGWKGGLRRQSSGSGDMNAKINLKTISPSSASSDLDIWDCHLSDGTENLR